MALMKLGIVATDIRGSVGGTVFSRNLGGAYTRARVAPVNRNSPKQTAVRAAFGAGAKLWSGTFTALQRSAWTFFAAANPLVNVLGSSIIVSGLAMSQKLNQVLAQIIEPTISDPPADLSVPALATIASITYDISVPTMTIDTAAQTVVAGAKWYVFASPPMASGKLPPSSSYRYIGVFEAVAAATTVDIYSRYTNAFGVAVVGQTIGALIATVNTDSGAVTPGLKFLTQAV
jgi:hypothetical protein